MNDEPITISEGDARTCLKIVTEWLAQEAASGLDPVLYDPGFHAEGWTIALEGIADVQWPMAISGDASVTWPEGVWVEPVNEWCLHLLPRLDVPRETSQEPQRYAWMRDGLLVAGTLQDYAKMWEGDYYAGDHDLTTQLLTWDGEGLPQTHRVEIKRGEMCENDWIPYFISVPSIEHETVRVSVDGRA
jgi:hypothetical protein